MKEGGRNVPELIDKAVLLNRIATEVHYDSERSLEMYAKLLNEINDAPDAVVRCKDCKWYDNTLMCYNVVFINEPDDFCSRGERREDAETD